MPKKILILSGSPKKNGNTETLINWFIEGARSKGAKTETVRLAFLKYKAAGCTSCRACQKLDEYECVINDGAKPVLKKMIEADVIVFATPLYFFSASAQTKIIFDRMFSLYKWDNAANTMETPLKGKTLVVIASAFEDVGLDALEKPFKLTASYTNMKFASLLIPNAGVSGNVRNKPGVRGKAVALGRKAALLILSLCCLSLMTGCAYLPAKPSSSYTKNLYRRIPYTTEGRYRAMNIFYATTRGIRNTKDSSLFFNNNMAENLTYGNLTIKIDPNIKIGKMLPHRLERRGLIGIQDVQKSEEDTFINQLSDAVKNSPHKSLLVIVFGYNDDFEATAIKAAYFSYLLDVNTPVLLFDWPGNQPLPIRGYKKARTYAISSGPYLGDLLTRIIRDVKPENLWIKASSLGCQIVCDAFDRMYKYEDLSDPDTEITHVILAAPDVSENEFDAQFKNEITAFSKKLTAYVSSDDTALLISGIINREKRLGREEIKENEQLDETKDLLYLKSLNPDAVSIIDVTPINNSSYKHGYYLESPEFYNDFYMRLFSGDSHANRCLYLLKTENNVDYWVLRGSE
ncbi:MAG: alpha/beta hydrolase [Candidatus Omnitrophica bacterium]|nr:alpha/beta hydrolase [Candidatus Omnitrophota bacterium]